MNYQGINLDSELILKHLHLRMPSMFYSSGLTGGGIDWAGERASGK